VCLLVPGTPLFATTHSDLIIRARELNICVEIVHNASIQSSFGIAGLFSYSFGRTVTIPFFTESWKPISFFENLMTNFRARLHTLCLLDIKVREPTVNALLGKEKDVLPDRYMTLDIALAQIEECMETAGDRTLLGCKLLAIERFGSSTETLHYGTIGALRAKLYGEPLHSLIVPAFSNEIEKEYVERYFSTASSNAKKCSNSLAPSPGRQLNQH
jgi:diphthine methyl ester synthase